MIRYGTKVCMSCCGFGIKLNSDEMTAIREAVLLKNSLPIIHRVTADIEQCPKCKGMGWIFIANYPHITLPNHTWDR